MDSNASCNGFADGGASASATGGPGSYTYTWSNAATTASITGVLAGTYSVTVTDANGCTDLLLLSLQNLLHSLQLLLLTEMFLAMVIAMVEQLLQLQAEQWHIHILGLMQRQRLLLLV